MSDDIYGKDPYKPNMWQRIKDWFNCKIRGRHLLPYVHSGTSTTIIITCSRCDYKEKVLTKERQFSKEILEEAVKATEPYHPKYDIYWGLDVFLKTQDNFVSLDDITEEIE